MTTLEQAHVQAIGRFASGTHLADVPEDVVGFARLLLVDTLGALLGGLRYPPVRELGRAVGAGMESGPVPFGTLLTLGTAATWLDADSGGSFHPQGHRLPPVPTAHPGPHGGNMDCKELTTGTTLYLPIFVPGALFSVGDGHGAQGDGEVDGAAVETGMERLVLRLTARPDLALERPRAETASHLMFLAFDEDLDEATVVATRDAIGFLERERGLSHDDAYNLCSLALDLRISQVVDGLKGVHAMLPKAIFTRGAPTFAATPA